MALKRWTSAAVLVASAAISRPLAHAQAVPSAATRPATSNSDTPVNPQDLIKQSTTELTNQLIGPAPAGARDDVAIQQGREEAAKRLLDRPQAVSTLTDALQNPVSRLAVAKAIADAPQLEPRFTAALLPLLGTEKNVSDTAARALARVALNDDQVRGRLKDFAGSAQAAVNLRVGVIKALGGVVTRDVADALVALATNPQQGPAIQNAASEALADLSGQGGNGHNVNWRQWQAANANKPDANWRADMLAGHDNRQMIENRARTEFADEMRQILREQYQKAAINERFAIMTRLLNATQSQTRAIGVDLLAEAFTGGGRWQPEHVRRLEDLVGDSDSNVRLRVAQTIKLLNDTDALDGVLTQLPLETNPDVKFALVDSLVRMKKMRALPVLQQLVADPSIQIATKAVEAIKGIAPTLVAQNPNQAAALAKTLWQLGLRRAGEPGGTDLQAAVIEAVGLLHDRDQALQIMQILNPRSSDRIRSAALRALAELHVPRTNFQIAQWLQNEQSPSVRIDAIIALGATASSFEEVAKPLNDYTKPTTEPDENVRQQAVYEFNSLLPRASIASLTQWQSDFQNDPKRRLPVLQELDKRLAQDPAAWENLAAMRQNTGETYSQLKNSAKSAEEFEAALDLLQLHGAANQMTVALVQQLLRSLIAARDYDKATAAAAKQLAKDRTQQDIVGRELKVAVDTLMLDGTRENDQQKLKDALRLAEDILKMQPPLTDRYLNDVRQIQGEIQVRLKKP